MTSHTIGMIHTCTITSRTQTGTDEYGSPVYTESNTTSACRFANPAGRTLELASGKHVASEPILILPSDAIISEGDTITSTVAAFSMEYSIQKVNPVYKIVNSTIHHYECDIKAVE